MIFGVSNEFFVRHCLVGIEQWVLVEGFHHIVLFQTADQFGPSMILVIPNPTGTTLEGLDQHQGRLTFDLVAWGERVDQGSHKQVIGEVVGHEFRDESLSEQRLEKRLLKSLHFLSQILHFFVVFNK